jgi:hypothetical protein
MGMAAAVVLLAGCHMISIPTPNGAAKVQSFGQRTVIKELSWSTNGTLTLKGYNNDQVTAISEAVAAGVAAGIKGAAP